MRYRDKNAKQVEVLLKKYITKSEEVRELKRKLIFTNLFLLLFSLFWILQLIRTL